MREVFPVIAMLPQRFSLFRKTKCKKQNSRCSIDTIERMKNMRSGSGITLGSIPDHSKKEKRKRSNAVRAENRLKSHLPM